MKKKNNELDKKTKLIHILLGVLSAAGITYVANILFDFIKLIFEKNFMQNPTSFKLILYGVIWISEDILKLVAGLILWKTAKLSKYYSRTLLFVIITGIIISLIFFVKSFVMIYVLD